MKIYYGWVIVGVGMVVTCIGLGTMMSLGVFLQPMSAALGWRPAMAVLGGIAWLVVISTGLLLRQPPVTHEAATAAPDGGAWTVARALRTPQFAAIALTFFACCAAHSGPIFHMVSYVADCGVTPMAAATVFGAAGLGGLGGRIVCGLIADRVGAKETMVAGLLLQAFAISLYL